MNIEIERKWLLKRLPDVPPARISFGYQFYLSVDPVIRAHRYEHPDGSATHFITVKGGGTISRAEFEIPISEQDYNGIISEITHGQEPIRKEYHVYSLDGYCDMKILAKMDEQLRIDVVDRGTPNEFIYAEVEFKTVDDARAFEFPFPECEAVDVTDDPRWKMSSYWERTRIMETIEAFDMIDEIGRVVYSDSLDASYRETDSLRHIIMPENKPLTVREVIKMLLIHCDLDMPIEVPDIAIRTPYVCLDYDSFGPPRFPKEFSTVSIRTGSFGGHWELVSKTVNSK